MPDSKKKLEASQCRAKKNNGMESCCSKCRCSFGMEGKVRVTAMDRSVERSFGLVACRLSR